MFEEKVWTREDVMNALQKKGFIGSDLQVQMLMSDARTVLDDIKKYSLEQLDRLVGENTAILSNIR